MVRGNGSIFRIITASVLVLAMLAVAEAGNSGVSYSTVKKRQTAYDILRKAKKQPQVSTYRPEAEIGPIVAEAQLGSAPITRNRSLGYFARKMHSTTGTRPPELRQVPADAPPDPRYFTVDIDDRKVHGIAYLSTDKTRRAKLRLDTDGDGLFSNERQYFGTWLRMFQIQRVYEFGPVTINHTGNGSKASWIYISCADGQRVQLYQTRYQEGRVELNGKAYKIALVDCNYNGRYNDVFVPLVKSKREPESDTIAIDLDGNGKFEGVKPGESEIMPLSRLVKVNESYYHIEVAEDGQSVAFHSAKPAFGTLDLGDENVALRLFSDTGHQYLISPNGKWRLPAGKYSAVELKLTRKDSAGNQWLFDTEKARGGAGAGKLGAFEIKPNETTSFEIGPPFKAKTSMNKHGNNAHIGFFIEGRAGELYVPGVKKNKKEVPEPQFQIIALGGQTVHSAQFGFA